jgi:glycosyltransferase involved in cell wall biosynthesis
LKVSIILLTSNRPEYFKMAVESIEAQTFKDFELIICDNSNPPYYTPDNARRVKESIADARNAGTEMAKGEFISYADDDNLYYPTRLEKCVAAFEAHPEVDVVHSQSTAIDKDGWEKGLLLHGKLKDFKYDNLRHRNYIDANETMFRKSPDLKFDNNLKTIEDWELVLRYYLMGKKFYYLQEPLIKYRMHAGQNIISLSPTHDGASMAYIRAKHGL